MVVLPRDFPVWSNKQVFYVFFCEFTQVKGYFFDILTINAKKST